MKSPFDVAKRYLEAPDRSAAEPVFREPITDPTEGRIIAVKICSPVLDACIWLIFDPDFKPDADEELAVFYDHELEFLRDKTVEQLKEIHRWKITFGPSTRVRQ